MTSPTPMRALIVDDSRAMRNMLARMLRPLGFELSEAADGPQVLDQLAAGARPDVILLDWNMPQMTGYDVVQVLRGHPEYAGIKIMMVTTETEMLHVSDALLAGADEYVMKPFNADVIVDKLRLLGLVAAG